MTLKLAILNDVLWEEDPSENRCYVYSPKDKDFLLFEGVEYIVWKQISLKSRDAGDIIKEILRNYSEEREIVENDVMEFLRLLQAKGLVE